MGLVQRLLALRRRRINLEEFVLPAGAEFGFRYRSDLMKMIEKPFSRGKWTYATNGHILVRVPRRRWTQTAIPFRQWARIVANFRKAEKRGFTRMPLYAVVTRSAKDRSWLVAQFSKYTFDIDYIEMIQSLPNVVVSFGELPADPMVFKFDGGEGLVMPLGKPRYDPDDDDKDAETELREAA